MPSFAAAPLLWAGIVTRAIIAVTRPSRSTLVVTAIAQSARLMHERNGFSDGSKSCCRLSTTISSAFLTHWCHSFGRTRESCLRFCSKPRPPLYWKWHLIRSILVPRLDSSASCTRGDRLSNSTLTFIVSCPVVAFPQSTPLASPQDLLSFSL